MIQGRQNVNLGIKKDRLCTIFTNACQNKLSKTPLSSRNFSHAFQYARWVFGPTTVDEIFLNKSDHFMFLTLLMIIIKI